MKNKIGIIGIRGLPAKYGAFDTFVDQLINSNITHNANNIYFVSCAKNFEKELYDCKNVERIFIYRGNGILILINYLLSIIIMLLKGVRKFIFFGYGAAIFFPLIKLFRGKIVCNPDGIEWRRPEGKLKKLFFKFSELLVSKQDISKIYDSKVIKKYYNLIHKSDGIVAYYPSGFENKTKIKASEKLFERFYILGRLLEENNTEIIIKAFSNSDSKQKLYIFGNSNDYFRKKILPIVNKSKNIFFIGPVYNREKLFRLCSLCDYYVHGHSVGGTNPTLIEAMNLQKKIISFKTFFNKEILGTNATYFRTEKDLINILKSGNYKSEKIPSYKKEFQAEHINKIYLDLVK